MNPKKMEPDFRKRSHSAYFDLNLPKKKGFLDLSGNLFIKLHEADIVKKWHEWIFQEISYFAQILLILGFGLEMYFTLQWSAGVR